MDPIGQAMSSAADQLLGGYDMSKVADNQFKILDPAFDYEAVIESAELGRSGTDGSNMVTIQLTVTWCSDERNWSQFNGTKIWDNAVLKETTLWKFKSICRACDLLTPDGSRFSGSSVKDFQGNVLRFKIKHDEYNGVVRNKVQGGYEAGRDTPGLQ